MVVATEYGVCPRCGLGPPNVVDTRAELDRAAWNDARTRARDLGVGAGYWLLVAGFAALIGIGAAALAVW